jgi:hypothetical protein
MQLYLAIGGFLVVILFAGVMGGLAIWARRLGSLISLHHHLAAGTSNKDEPERGAFRKLRRLISPERRNRQRDI